MSMDQVTEKPKRTISPELKAKMAAGRAKSAASKAKNYLKPGHVSADPPVLAESDFGSPNEFLGLTQTNCPIGCTPQRCAIGGSLHFKNSDGTTTLEGVCCHPYKGGLKPIHQTKPVIVERFNRAVEYLEHQKIEQKRR